MGLTPAPSAANQVDALDPGSLGATFLPMPFTFAGPAEAAATAVAEGDAEAVATAKRYLFVCGCPRSGTTAMWRLLAASRQVVLGVERYALRMDRIERSMFERERFLKVEPGDTFYDDLHSFSPYYRNLPARFDQARWVGDKSPRLYDWFDNLKAQFPGATVLMMFRNIYDVAASYKRRAQDENDTFWGRGQGVEAALGDWTRSIQAFHRHRDGLDLVPVCYERLLSRHEGLEAVFAHLDLPLDDAVRAQYDRIKSRSPGLESRRDRVLSTDEVFDLCMRAPIGAYRQVLEAAP